MLYFDEPRTIEWTTVFRDDEDPNRYWYLPNHISLAQRDGKPVFQLIRYGGKKGAPGGAFLNFEVNLELPEQLVGRIKARIPTLFGEWGMQATPDKLSLNVVQWDSGTVQCMAL